MTKQTARWGSGLPDTARDSIIDMVGYHLVLIYGVISPTAAIALLLAFLCRMMADIRFRENAIASV
jgi:hypothetical protein